jgi:hypothetical protein
MTTFDTLQENTDIQDLIKTTFDADLPVSGDWGYTQEKATIIKDLSQDMPLTQLEHMITTIRAHLEMNITQEENHRYGAINANELSREESQHNGLSYAKVTYEVTGIKEDLFKQFIAEYKEGYEKEGFDLSEHFRKRKEATLTRTIVHYFEESQIK